MNKNALIIFAKRPVSGKVKTRLANGTSEEFALLFYKVCLDYFFSMTAGLSKQFPIDTFFYFNEQYDTAGDHKVQTGDTLGDKMGNAFKEIFELGYDKVCIIGTDIPDISPTIIKNAFDALENNDYVIGPADDGGYYLLGMKKPETSIFNNISWSTSSVLTETIQNIGKASYRLFDILIDIDTLEELTKWINCGHGNHELKGKIRTLMKDFKV
ncbi:MAG: hypothetical protein SCALA702_37210 [Melioribacteraceae bacterium]|nr:MAG: hypothetical protein SCALA702_37210 [Melioribacteraceae bacterium]